MSNLQMNTAPDSRLKNETNQRRIRQLESELVVMLATCCQFGIYGRYSVEWTVEDGVIQSVRLGNSLYVKDVPKCERNEQTPKPREN